MAFVTTRVHRRGEIGNAILSRWPITSVFTLDLSFSRVERRSAVAAQFQSEAGPLSVVATHLALVDRTRRLQVDSILGHPQLQGAVLWRATSTLAALQNAHPRGASWSASSRIWPRSFPPRGRARPRPHLCARADCSGERPRQRGGARASDHRR
jgi:endonuclease/exonuclease/phosphatase family metal-dependent hydrolase